MIGVDTLDPNTDHLVIYAYHGNIGNPEQVDRMGSIPEEDENEDAVVAE